MGTTFGEFLDWAGTEIWTASPFGLALFATFVIVAYRRVAK